MTTKVICGFDPGNSQTTLALRIGGKIHFLTMPSYIGSGELSELMRVQRGGPGEGAGLTDDEYAITLDGTTSFVGKLALGQSKNATTARGSLDRYSNGHTLKLLLTLAGRLFKEPVTLYIITGMPIKFWDETEKKRVQAALCGTHRYSWAGKLGNRAGDRWLERTTTVESVGVLMEGAAVLHDTANEPVDQVVADAGGGTLDLYFAHGRKPQYEKCASFDDCGVDIIGDTLKRKVRAMTNGRLLSDEEIKNVLFAHIHNKPLPRLTNRGQDIVLNGEIESAIKTVGADQIARVHRLWDDTEGQVAPSAAYAKLIGGGAYYFKEVYKAALPHVTVPENPERANALAYLLVGEAASDEAWARNRA